MSYDIVIGRDNSDKSKFGQQGLIYLGKGYVTMGNYTSLSNRILMDVARSHVILVAGKRGCLAPETMIFTNNGYKKIIDFKEGQDKILSFDKEKKEFEWEEAKLLKYPIEKEDLLKVELEDGRQITMTNEHPLLCSYGKYIYWRQATELKEGDKLIVPLEIPEIAIRKDSLRLARLLGYILADGNIDIRRGRFIDGRGSPYNGTKSRIRIFNADNEVLEQARNDFTEEFGVYAKRYKRNDCNCEVVQVLTQQVANQFVSLGIPAGNKSSIIRIPRMVFENSNEFKAQFINALFSCDGYIPEKGRYLDYCSNSKGFLYDLQLLLTHFRIESSIRKKITKLNGKELTSYRLFITDNKSIEQFKRIGSIVNFKQERLAIHQANGTKKRKTHYIGENLVCKKIKKIETVKGIPEVYDLTVPKNHSFIANGIISHNSGKSYSLGVIAEELATLAPEVAPNIASLIFDTMGIFWTMKFKNEKEKALLDEWKLETRELPVRVFVPAGKAQDYELKQIPFDETFKLVASELAAEDWLSIFNLTMTQQEGVLITSSVAKVRAQQDRFSIQDILRQVEHENTAHETKNTVRALFEAATSWGIFSDTSEGTEIASLVKGGLTTILDLSAYSSLGAFNVRALVIGLVSRKLFEQRMSARKNEELQAVHKGQDYLSYNNAREMPLIWLFVDEAHEFLPRDSKTPATEALVQLLREGRQPGISLVLATQQPGKIHTDVMTQSDIVLSHRVTSEQDVKALNEIMQSYVYSTIQKKMDELPALKGSALMLDDNSERIYAIRIRPRFTWHGGEAPTAVKAEKII